MKLRVLFVSEGSIEQPSSGSERVLYHQAHGLARRGCAVAAITRRYSCHPLRLRDFDGFREAQFSIPSQTGVRSVWRTCRLSVSAYRQLSKTERFDWVVVHQPLSYLFLLSAGCLKHIPRLYVFHSPWHQEYLLKYKKPGIGHKSAAIVRRVVERICVMKSDKIITLSQYMKDKLQAVHGIYPINSVVIPGGVDLDEFKPLENRLQIKAELGFPRGALHLLTVRNLESRMGLDNLLESMRIVISNRHKIHLTIVGEGPERKHLQTLVANYRLEDQVTMKGAISAADLVKHYAAADFFVLPTRDLEGFGLVTPESMACGTPVLGTPVGGTQEILAKFDPRFLFTDNGPKAIAAGISEATGKYRLDGPAYVELRRRCREFVEQHYSWDRHVQQLSSILASAKLRLEPSAARRAR